MNVKQAFRFASTDHEHIDRLLVWADLPVRALVLDLGAGTGTIAVRMKTRRPDLSFCLVDKDPEALEGAGPEFRKHFADICSVPEPDNTFDAAICCYAIGYAPLADFFREVVRLLRRAAPVFIVDLGPLEGAKGPQSLFGYAIHDRASVELQAASAGLALDFYMEPKDNRCWGEAQFPGFFNIFFGDVRPVIWRFTLP